MPKKILIALPPAMLEEIDHIAAAEHRTRSDLLREGMRRYIKAFNAEHQIKPMIAVEKAITPVELPAEEPSEPAFGVVQFPTNNERMQFAT